MAVVKDMDDVRPNTNGVIEEPKLIRRPHSAHTFPSTRQSPGNSPSESRKQYPWVNGERWKELRKMSETAVKERKVFLIKGGGFPAIRNALTERGWIEKSESLRPRGNNYFAFTNDTATSQDPLSKTTNDSEKNLKLKCERAIMHKFLEHQPVDFLWTSKRDKYDWMLVKSDVIISRFCRSNFTSKEGLCSSLNQMYWYTEPSIANIHFPRCYNLHNQDQLDEFVEDFRLTACVGLLKWLMSKFSEGGAEAVASSNGKVPLAAMEFAIDRLEEYLNFVCHKDIDEVDDISKHVWEHEWDQFLTQHYLVIHENAKFIDDKSICISTTERTAAKLLIAVGKHWPQMEMDGVMNIWIVKPGNKCRGKGIQLMNNIKDIVGIVNFPLAAKTRFVVQKYIENPLIVYNTKFDIRQWFLITNSQPMTIWMYKESYLRFSSQLFNLTNYHESVHLTNNAVQSKYKNHGQRDKALPEENMWDCHTFKTYLRQIGKSNMWDERIYPGMKECLIGTMLACQDSMDRRQNSFELYGADFMLTEDFTPWLIEINSSPDLAPTTSVTARLCPQCLEDIIKVVIDRRTNPEANTGMFELVYKQIIPRAPAYLGLSLSISGKKIFKKIRVEKPKMEREITSILTKPKSEINQELDIPIGYAGPIITDLLAWLKPCKTEVEETITEVEKKKSTVQHALTVVKSGLLMKTSSRRNKKTTSTMSLMRGRSAKKDKGQNFKIKTPSFSNYCFITENETLKETPSYKDWKKNFKSEENKKIERVYWHDPETKNKSVGNKRCYIEPATWERDTASILRSCSTSVLQQKVEKLETKQLIQVTPRAFSPSIVSVNKIYPMLRKAENVSINVDNESSKSGFSGVGLNIKRLKHFKRDMHKKVNDAQLYTKSYSFYGPYRTVPTPEAMPN